MSINWSNNQILSKKRKGTQNDPFILIEESLPCVNCKALLTEAPNKFQKVTINYSEEYSNDKDYILGDLVYYTVNGEKQTFECILDCKNIIPTNASYWTRINFIEKQNNELLNKHEYYVDYLSGVVTHHSYFSNHSLIYKYLGEGATFYPANRIWTKANGSEVVETLQSIIDSGQDAIDAVDGLQPKIDEAYALKENLEEDITVGQNLEVDLEGSISTGSILHANLQDDISAADDSKSNLDDSISLGQATNSNLSTTINDAENTKINLDSSITTGNNLKTSLEGNISTGNILHTNLQEDISIGSNLKMELEIEVIPNSQTAKTNLEGTISTASTTNEILNVAISTANTTKSNLDDSITISETTKSDLNIVVDNANIVNNELSNPIDGAIKIADDKNIALNTTISDANTVDNNLNTTISTADLKNTTLNTTINTANTTKNDLDDSISIGQTTKSDLDNTVVDANTINNALSTPITGTIDVATQKNTDLNTTISNADSKNITLNNTIDSTNTLINDISTAVGTATTAKSNLDTTISNANVKNTELNTTIINANTAKSELETTIIEADLDRYISATQVGVPNGVASLDENGLVHSSQLSIKQALKVVNNITERDALVDKYDGMKVHVSDASADTTVDSGWAEYLWTGIDWKKVAEKESIDVILDWGNIENKPIKFEPINHTHISSQVTGLTSVATSGDYNDLINKPIIPSKTSNLINDSDFITITSVDNKLINKVDKVAGKGLSAEDYTTIEKNKLAGIEDGANKYTHPTTAGNKHIPTGGTTGQILKNTASGTATWQNETDTITTINGKTGAIVKADIVALGIPAQDTVYAHPANHPASIITQDSNNRFVTDAEKSVWNAKETPTGSQTKADSAESNAKNFAGGLIGTLSSLATTVKTNIVAAINELKGDQDNLQNTVSTHLADGVKHISYATASGTNTYTVSVPDIESLTEGLSLKIKFTNANTGAATLNINSLGAKAIQKFNGSTLASGNIKAGQIVHLVYTGSVFQLLGEGGEYGTATAAEVLSGYTLGTENGIVSGSLALTGDAATGHVLSGKTFYNTNAKSKLTGTLIEGAKIKSIQRVEMTINGGNDVVSANKAISSVNVNNSIIILTGFTSSYDTVRVSPYLELINSNTVSIKFTQLVTGTTLTVSFDVIEFASLKSIQRGTLLIPAGTTTADLTISPVNVNNAITILSGYTGTYDNMGIIPYIKLLNSVTLRAIKQSSSSSHTATVSYQIIEL